MPSKDVKPQSDEKRRRNVSLFNPGPEQRAEGNNTTDDSQRKY